MSSCRSYSSPSIGTMCFQCFYYPSWTNLSSKTIYNWLNDPPLLSEFIGAFHPMSSVALGSFPQHAIYAFSWFTNLIDTNICFWIVRNELKIENKLNLAKVKWFEKSQFGYQKNFQMIGGPISFLIWAARLSVSVWPDWVIFGASWWHNFVQKYPKYSGKFLGFFK